MTATLPDRRKAAVPAGTAASHSICLEKLLTHALTGEPVRR